MTHGFDEHRPAGDHIVMQMISAVQFAQSYPEACWL
jgi:hypothetical protein